MKAAVLTEPYRIELVEQALPDLRAGQLRIRIVQCGVCASELDLWVGKAPDKLPAPIGHEVAGVVEELGDGVTAFAVGDRVAAWVHGGGFAEQAIVEERFCVPVASGVSYPAVAEPLACVVNAVELAAPALADDVVIIGAGYMGNLIQMVTALKGPRSIVVADVRADALERATRLGATRVVDTAAESLADVVQEVTDGRGADLTYEVTGIGPGLELAGDVTRMSGKLCIVGYHQGGTRAVPLGEWNWMAYQLVNAHFRDTDTIMAGMHAGMRLVNAGVLDASSLVTASYPLEQVSDAFEAAAARPEGFVKAVIETGA
ncbi:MAG TPA: alcohol dehydrogenase catalytic domain-containing protein [Conexibacter sp.]|nr:alcohol dehydrogenase catalytic domain-containing protein [Conexibacter sp.]